MYHKILVPLDGSELAECVLEHVKEIALPRCFGVFCRGELTIKPAHHIFPMPEALRCYSQLLKRPELTRQPTRLPVFLSRNEHSR